jgi:hypothetical protein
LFPPARFHRRLDRFHGPDAKVYVNTRFTAKQQVFLDFVLKHYITVGVEELGQQKLTP